MGVIYLDYFNNGVQSEKKLQQDIQDTYNKNRLMNNPVNEIIINFKNNKDAVVTGIINTQNMIRMDIIVEKSNGGHPVANVPYFISDVTAGNCIVSFNPDTNNNILKIKGKSKWINVKFNGRIFVNSTFGFNNIRACGHNKGKLNVLNIFGTTGMAFDSYVKDANYCIPIEVRNWFKRDSKEIYDIFKAMLDVCKSETWYKELKYISDSDSIKFELDAGKNRICMFKSDDDFGEEVEAGSADFSLAYNNLIGYDKFMIAVYKAFGHYHKQSW